MRILLINPPDDLESLLGEGANLITPFEPLGLLYIAAALRQEGREVSVIDAYVEKLDVEHLQAIITEKNPDIIGMTVFTSNGGIVYALGRWMKQTFPHCFVVLGNVHASVYAEPYLRNGCCDAVVHGEGEETMVELVRELEKPTPDLSRIPSVSFLRDGQFVPPREYAVVNDLSTLPPPARDLVKQELYNIPAVSNLPYSGKKTSIGKHMFTSRGCPNRCTFCTVHHGRQQRFHPVPAVLDEMESLQNDYGADYVFIMDSLFIGKKSRVIEICRGIRERGLRLRWGCEAHVRFLDEELVREMEAAGCHDMAFGIESGVQRLLDVVKKNITLDQVTEAIRTVKRVSDIKISGLFILGLPGETPADTEETIRFACSLPLDMAQFSILTPYPGSAIFEELRARGEIDDGIRPDGSLDPSVWKRYSAYISYTDNDPIWVTPAHTAASIKAAQKRALRAFYFRPRHFWAQLKRIRIEELPTIVRTAFKTFF